LTTKWYRGQRRRQQRHHSNGSLHTHTPQKLLPRSRGMQAPQSSRVPYTAQRRLQIINAR
jgi:hypothetical protein